MEKEKKMKTRELIFVTVIAVYISAAFSVLVYEYDTKVQDYERKPMQMVELSGNGSSRTYEIENPSPMPNIFSSILGSIMQFTFSLPLVVAGIAIIGIPIAVTQSNMIITPETYYGIIFWIASIGTIPIVLKFLKELSWWRKVPYTYLLTAIISGTPILISTRFGQ